MPRLSWPTPPPLFHAPSNSRDQQHNSISSRSRAPGYYSALPSQFERKPDYPVAGLSGTLETRLEQEGLFMESETPSDIFGSVSSPATAGLSVTLD